MQAMIQQLSKTKTSLGLWAISTLALCTISSTSFGALISVDLQSATSSSVNSAGVEPLAATAATSFAAANVWNHLAVSGTSTDPSFSNLVDSTGSATPVGFSITGTLGAFSFGNATETVRTDFFYFNSRASSGISANLMWQITGLTPNTPYNLFQYGSTVSSRLFVMLIDKDADGDLSNITAQVVGTTGTLITNVFSNANGTIEGQADGVGPLTDEISNEANWNGFQISDVPEPTTFMIFALGGLALVTRRT